MLKRTVCVVQHAPTLYSWIISSSNFSDSAFHFSTAWASQMKQSVLGRCCDFCWWWWNSYPKNWFYFGVFFHSAAAFVTSSRLSVTLLCAAPVSPSYCHIIDQQISLRCAHSHATAAIIIVTKMHEKWTTGVSQKWRHLTISLALTSFGKPIWRAEWK